MNKYTPDTAPSLLKLKGKFDNSKLAPAEWDPDEGISYLEGLRFWMSKFGAKGNTTDKDFLSHILNN